MNPKSAAGIILLAGSPLVWFLVFWLVVPELYVQLYMSGLVSEFIYYSILYGPLCALIIVGLALYIAGRKEFWKRVDEHQNILFLFVTLGLVLIILGFLLSLATYSSMLYYTWKPAGRQSNQLLVDYSPALLWFALWIISGITLLADGLKALWSNNATQILVKT